MTEDQKPVFFKRKMFWIHTAAALVIFFTAFFIGSYTRTISLNEEKLKYEEVTMEIEKVEKRFIQKQGDQKDLEKDVELLDEKKEEINEQVKALEKDLSEAEALVAEKDTLQADLKKLEESKKSKDSELDAVEAEIDTKKEELAIVTGKIIELKEEPKTLSAGFFTVGKDIPAARYKVTPNGNGNFFVNEGAKVNIMIGSGSFYESEYIFEALEGDEIELTTSAHFTPIQ
ncbi:hypothetical protein GLW04_12860 [Halobacillus litoralis]|uniref:Uncharacterized protein n=1 Tax=Halobacillus litoralis TaxID=45668 RepID=A0A845DWC9_9BACI|nr:MULTISPECIES: hypothetical protein [Halobacillus]MYL20785.1 hypothetical protein [Halobacillus litoralis]MYL30826.1 hypothetical protein [Halobacillus halophilus]